MTRASDGNLARTPGYTLLFTTSAWDFLMTTESRTSVNVSSERRL